MQSKGQAEREGEGGRGKREEGRVKRGEAISLGSWPARKQIESDSDDEAKMCVECCEWGERQQQRLHCIPAGELSITFGPAGRSQICFWQRGELNLVAT